MGTALRGRSRRRLRGVGVAALLTAGLVWGLAGALATSSSPAPAGKVVLKLGMTNIPDNLNPFVGQLSSCYEIWSLKYDLMVGFSAGDYGHPQGAAARGLADSWAVSDGGKVWTFHIRSGATWQDGVPVTAHDVAFTYNYVIKNQLSNYTMYTNFLKSVTAPNDNTVVFTCTKPKANMLNMWVYILPQHIWSHISGKAAGADYQNNPPVVGSGPFQLTQYKRDSYAVMTANKSYWGGAPKIDEVDFVFYQSADTMVQEMKSGALQGCWGVLDAEYRQLQNDPTYKPVAYVDPELDELAMNCYTGPSLGNPALKDWHFRQALQYAVDHDKLVQIAYGGLAQPATSVLVSHLWSNPDWHWQPPADQAYGYDPARATQLLAAAGYRTVNGKLLDKRGKPIVLRLFACDAPPQGDNIGKLLAGYLGAIGIDVKFVYMDEGAMNDYLYNTVGGKYVPNVDLYIYNWTGDVDPMFIFSIFLTNQINGWSDCAWSNPTYDRLYAQQAAAIDPSQRQAILFEMQRLLYQQSPYIILAYPKGLEAVNTSRWTGWVQSPSGDGSAIYSVDNIDSYLSVHRVSAAVTTRSHGPLITFLITAVISVVLIVIVLVLRRRRPQAVET